MPNPVLINRWIGQLRVKAALARAEAELLAAWPEASARTVQQCLDEAKRYDGMAEQWQARLA